MSAGLLALLDDLSIAARKIATMAAATSIDDVAAMAAGGSAKATGVVVDDMAVTAGGMTGMHNDRETSFVLQVAKGSLKNKMYYLVPGALVINFVAPGVMPWLLMGGGAFLAYEGTEKVHHMMQHKAHHDPAHDAVVAKAKTPAEVEAYEEKLVADAIKTDFVLSAEIVAISLAAMQSFANPFAQALALSTAAVAMTAGVYGTVLALVKIDDLGIWMQKKGQTKSMPRLQKAGQKVIEAAPGLFSGLGVVGTVAMLAVGGGLIMHGLHAVPGVEGAMHAMTHAIEHAVPMIGGALATVAEYSVFAAAALATGAGLIVTNLPDHLGKVVEFGQRAVQKCLGRTSSPAAPAAPSTPSPSVAPAAPEVAPTRTFDSISGPPALAIGTDPKPTIVPSTASGPGKTMG